MKLFKLFKKGQKGVTLVELMVVMAILAILAGIIVPAVTGVSTTGRGAAMGQDIQSVQGQVNAYAADNPAGSYPTLNGNRPTGNSTAAILWDATFVGGESVAKIFNVKYQQKMPKHYNEFVAPAGLFTDNATAVASGTIGVWSATPTANTATRGVTPGIISAWALDSGALLGRGAAWTTSANQTAQVEAAINTNAVWVIDSAGNVDVTLDDTQY